MVLRLIRRLVVVRRRRRFFRRRRLVRRRRIFGELVTMLSDADRIRVIEAIRAAEALTSGEIYCVVTRASSMYRVFPLAYAASIALMTPLPLLHFTAWPAMVIYLLQLLTFLAVLWLTTRENIRYRLVPGRTRRERAHQEAVRQFAAHGLQHTELRTGVLIFVSFGERYAEVIADAGIDRKVSPDVWRECVAALVADIAAGRIADGFVQAIDRCAGVLATHFPPGAINRDELPNAIVELWPLKR
jgi:putative membrane protein